MVKLRIVSKIQASRGRRLKIQLSLNRRVRTQELQLELEAVRLRLLRRSQIIDVLRSAYVRDVVMIKNELMRKSAMTDEVKRTSGAGTSNSFLTMVTDSPTAY